MGLVVPGFIPTPLGEIVEYSPSLNETLVCLGIWAFGILCYTVFLRMAIPILQGRIAKNNEGSDDSELILNEQGAPVDATVQPAAKHAEATHI
jgi:molybdopterin-containing oxidoreductase family membrane subunit